MEKNTKEQDIIDFITNSGHTITNKSIMTRFNVSENYVKSLKWRLDQSKLNKSNNEHFE